MLGSQSLKTVLIVGHEQTLQDSLYGFFRRQQAYHPICLADGHQLPALLHKSRVDLLVLDAGLPANGGLYWLKWLQQSYPHIPVIITSVEGDKHERLAWLEYGARDYVFKPFLCQELFIKVDNLLGGNIAKASEHPTQIGVLELDTQTRTVRKYGEAIKLTLMEIHILKLLYLHSGSPVSRDEIMALCLSR